MRIEALRYRSLLHVSQSLGSFHVLAGPNACGKSTFLDVPAFMGDVLDRGVASAIWGDERLGIPMRATDARHLTWRRQGGTFELAVEMIIPENLRSTRDSQNGNRTVCRYEVAIDVDGLPKFNVENLWLKPESSADPEPSRGSLFPQKSTPPAHIVYRGPAPGTMGWKKLISRSEAGPRYVNYRSETTHWRTRFRIEATRSALVNLPEDREHFPVAIWFRETLKGVTRIVLSSEAMRLPSPPAAADELLPDGSNLPHIVHALECNHREHYLRWLRHLQEILPNVESVTTREREEDRRRYLVLSYDTGLVLPAWLVSDGTLRLMALTLLAYIPDLSGTYLIEEPENGVHPRAVKNVIRSLSSVYGARILLTTYSSLVARLARPDQLLCLALADNGETDIVAGNEHPRLKNYGLHLTGELP